MTDYAALRRQCRDSARLWVEAFKAAFPACTLPVGELIDWHREVIECSHDVRAERRAARGNPDTEA